MLSSLPPPTKFENDKLSFGLNLWFLLLLFMISCNCYHILNLLLYICMCSIIHACLCVHAPINNYSLSLNLNQHTVSNWFLNVKLMYRCPRRRMPNCSFQSCLIAYLFFKQSWSYFKFKSVCQTLCWFAVDENWVMVRPLELLQRSLLIDE